jgi:hypothetical protein
MPIFSKSPAKVLADAKAARDKLAERLRDAEIAVADLRQEAERLALDGATDEALSAAEARTREKVDRVTTLQAALTQSKTAVADLERERDEAADRKQREAISAETEALARAISSDCSRLIAIAASLHDHTSRAFVVVPESAGVAHLCQIIASQIPEASTLIGQLLRAHGQAVLDGRAAATLKEPEAFAAPPPTPARPPTMTLFCLGKPVKWVDANGKLHVAAKFTDVTLPLKPARRGLELRLLVQLDDPVRKQAHRTVGGSGDPSLAVDLDAAEPERTAPGVLHSAFETPVVGEPRVIKIATVRS